MKFQITGGRQYAKSKAFAHILYRQLLISDKQCYIVCTTEEQVDYIVHAIESKGLEINYEKRKASYGNWSVSIKRMNPIEQ